MRTAAGARHAVVVILLVLAGLFWTGHAEAQFFVRPVCSTMTNAQLGWTCSETSTLTLKQYNGAVWVPAGVGAGVGSLNSLTGSLALVGTLNEISVVSGGTTIQLSTPQAIAPTSAVAFANVAVNAQGRLDLFNAATSLRASFQAPVLTETYTIRLPTSVSGVANGNCLLAGTFAAGVLPTTFGPCPGGGGGGNITSIGGQAGPVIGAGANDTNVTLTWAANTVTPGWAGVLAPIRGGLGGNFSASTGLLYVNAGVVTATATVPNLTVTSGLVAGSISVGIGSPIAGAKLDVRDGSINHVDTDPTMLVSLPPFAWPGAITGPFGASVFTTWTAASASLGGAFVAQSIVDATAPIAGSSGGVEGGVLNFRNGADIYGVLGLVNNDITVATPTGAAVWGIARGTPSSTGSVDGLRSTSEYSVITTTGSTHSNTTLDVIASGTANMRAGMGVTGSGIPAGTSILSVDSASAVTLSAPTTATGAGVAIVVGVHPRSGLLVTATSLGNLYRHGIWIANAWEYGLRIGEGGNNADPSVAAIAVTPSAGGTSFSITMGGVTTATQLGIGINPSTYGVDISRATGGVVRAAWTGSDAAFNTIYELKSNANFRFYVRANGEAAIPTGPLLLGTTTNPGNAMFDARGPVIVSKNTAVLPAMITDAVLQLANVNATQTLLEIDAFGNQSGVLVRRANGTPTARTVLVADNPIGAIQAGGAFDATNYSGVQAALGFFAGGTWAAGNTPTYLTLSYTPVGSTTLAEAARFGALPGVSGTQPTLLKLGRTVTGDLTSVTVNVTAGDGPAGVAFPLYVLGKFSDFTVTPGAGSTTAYAIDMVRNLVTLGGYSSPGGSVGKMIYSEYTGTMSAAHQEYYGVAALSVINPSAAACAGGCAFPNIASQAFIKHSTDAVVSAFDAQIVNRPSDGVMGTGGVYGLRIVNGNDNITTGLVTAQDALYIKAKAGSGAGVEGWANAIRLHDAVGLVDRFLLGNDGTIVSRASVLPAVDGAGGSVGTAAFRWLSMYGVTMRGDAFVTAGGVAGADCPAGVSGAATRVVKGIVTVC